MRRFKLYLLLVLAAGCALPQSGEPPDRPAETLRLENTTGDLLRVYLELGDRQVLIGRVDPFQRGVMRIPPAMLTAGDGSARLLVVPLGTTQPIGSPVMAGIRSDLYRTADFVDFPWQYSGSRLFMLMTR